MSNVLGYCGVDEGQFLKQFISIKLAGDLGPESLNGACDDFCFSGAGKVPPVSMSSVAILSGPQCSQSLQR